MKTASFRGGCPTGPNHSGTQLHGFLAYLMKCAVSESPYERGAFTGSDTAKPGLIETAQTGTLFLDEITTFKSKSAEQAFGGASGAQRSATV